MKRFHLLLLVALLATPLLASAQDDNVLLPAAFRMNRFGTEYQGWNNCGPATLTNALVHFGYQDDQNRAANWLKPDGEDKNVSPWQMVEYVNTQIPELPVYGIVRSGGSLETLKTLIVQGFPVLIEKGYEPSGFDWMGHYLLISGYDDQPGEVTTMDSFKGPDTRYSYESVNEYWQHFNYSYIVLYTADREAELMALLDADADEWQNHINSLEMARAEAMADPEDAHAWFNMGSSFVNLGMFDVAAQAYDQAISLGLPWRMMWYQFGPYEAYYRTGRFDDMIALARQNQNDGGGHFVEETWHYLGMAREGRGEYDKALQNYDTALSFNPNFSPAREAKERLAAQVGA